MYLVILGISKVTSDPPWYRIPNKNAAGKIRKNTKGRFGKSKNTIYNAHSKGALPRDVIHVPALAGGAGKSERWFACKKCNPKKARPPSELSKHVNHPVIKHPTQKPMGLTKKLILSKINGSGNVLIPFSGSGSECVVAKSLGVPFLGIDINPIYVDFGKSWLKQ